MNGVLGFILNTGLLQDYGWRLVQGLQITLTVVGVSCAIGFVLAFPICWLRMSRNMLLSYAALGYTNMFRGTPLLCQLYLIYYGGGEFRPFFQDIGIWWFFRDAYFCCILGFTLNTAAYQSEILRGAISSVPKGQIEAARALGLHRLDILRHIIVPQALLVAMRPLGNELISVVKASALAAIVTLLDLMGETRFIFARTYDFSIYLYCALIYLAITETIRRCVNGVEHRLSGHIRAGVQPETKGVGRLAAAPRASEITTA